MTTEPSTSELTAEVEELRARLAEAEEALRAIHHGNVDAVVVSGERGEQVYTLGGADKIYRQLIETMSEGAATMSVDGVILYCNARLAQMLGQPLDQVLGTDLRDYLPPADQSALDAILAQVHTAPIRQEINLKTSDGRLVPVYLSASRLHGEEVEMVICLVFTDLTEQRVQDLLRQSEERFRILFDRAADIILVLEITPESTPMIRDANSATFRILGYERDELIDQPVSFIEAAPTAAMVVEKRRRDILSGAGQLFEARHRCKDGTIHDFECSVAEMRIGSKTFAVSVERDITDRKRTAEKINGQLDELQRWQDVMLDREDRVQELKREVNMLLKRLGEQSRYSSQESP